MKIAAIQMNSGPEVEANLAAAGALLAEAARQGARVAVLPENFALMGRRERDKLAVAEPSVSGGVEGPIQAFLSDTARQRGLCIIGGTIPLKVDGETRVAPACVVYGADGAVVGRYDKIHLFDVEVPGKNETYRESASMVPGRIPVVVATPAGRAGLSVCYDVRFPELYRRLSAGPDGADFLTVPAAFTVPTGEAHWHILLRARAIENLCCVVAAAQVGEHANGRRTYGHSMIVDCWGNVLGELPQGTGVVVAEFDREKQAATRMSFPALAHRVF